MLGLQNGKNAMSGAKHHDYHLVNPSVWPLIGSIAALTMFFGLVMFMHAEKSWWRHQLKRK